jgi:hypothetical protein
MDVDDYDQHSLVSCASVPKLVAPGSLGPRCGCTSQIVVGCTDSVEGRPGLFLDDGCGSCGGLVEW